MVTTAQSLSRKEARKEELLEAALAVIRRDGPGASMDAMAAEAGVTKPILYRHFGDKNGIHLAVAQRTLGQVLGEMEKTLVRTEPGPASVAAAMDAYLQFIDRETSVYRFLCAVDPDREGAKGFGAAFADTLAGYLAGVGFDRRVAEVWAHGMVGMVEQAGDWWLEDRLMPRKRVVELLAHLVWFGFDGINPEDI